MIENHVWILLKWNWISLLNSSAHETAPISSERQVIQNYSNTLVLANLYCDRLMFLLGCASDKELMLLLIS